MVAPLPSCSVYNGRKNPTTTSATPNKQTIAPTRSFFDCDFIGTLFCLPIVCIIGRLLLFFLNHTVAKTVNYPMQDTTIHTIVGTQLWAVTIEGKQNQASQDSNRSCPNESGEHGNPSVATATPRLRQCMTQA